MYLLLDISAPQLTFSSTDKADPQKTHSFALLGEDPQKLGSWGVLHAEEQQTKLGKC